MALMADLRQAPPRTTQVAVSSYSHVTKHVQNTEQPKDMSEFCLQSCCLLVPPVTEGMQCPRTDSKT